MSHGVIYYNRGTKMLCRLCASVFSLRQVYDGPVTILSQGRDSHGPVKLISDRYGVSMKKVTYKTREGKGATYVNATLSHEKTPYDVSVWLDSDTIILRAFPELFTAAEKGEFAIARFSNWGTANGHIAKRIRAWTPLYPEWIKPALEYGIGINCGVFAFRKDSTLMRDWWHKADPGRNVPGTWIQDEVCCQLMLPHYPHKIMPPEFNSSCKYGTEEKPRVIHYHGRKHCRIDDDGNFLHKSDQWYRAYARVREFAKEWEQHDRQLEQAKRKHPSTVNLMTSLDY